MPQVSVSDVLTMPVVRRGGPLVLAGKERLDRPLRWVHATELTDIAPLLRPGDLVLTTGTGLPADQDSQGLSLFARSLDEAGCAGLLVEYGRRWVGALPEPLVEACRSLALPLVALTHEVRFAELAQTIGERIVDGQLADLRDAERVHETFTELSFTQAGPAEVLDAVQRLAAAPVVLENVQHRPLEYLAGPEKTAGFLDGWAVRSARVHLTGRTAWDQDNGWLVTRLGPSESGWGRLVIGSPGPPAQRLIAVAERAAAALALHRLHDRDRDNLMRRSHYELLVSLQSDPSGIDVERRCELIGFPVARRRFVGLTVRRRTVGGRTDLDEVVASVLRTVDNGRGAAVVCEIDRDVRGLLSVPRGSDDDALVESIATDLVRQHDVVVCAGRSVSTLATVDRTLLEARQVADAIPVNIPLQVSGGAAPAVHRLQDVHVRGLVALLAEDERLRLYVDRELSALRAADAASRTGDLMAALRALLWHPSSKSDAAASLHLSRAAFYDRLAKIQRVLDIDLDDPDIRLSLHLALVADELTAQL